MQKAGSSGSFQFSIGRVHFLAMRSGAKYSSFRPASLLGKPTRFAGFRWKPGTG